MENHRPVPRTPVAWWDEHAGLASSYINHSLEPSCNPSSPTPSCCHRYSLLPLFFPFVSSSPKQPRTTAPWPATCRRSSTPDAKQRTPRSSPRCPLPPRQANKVRALWIQYMVVVFLSGHAHVIDYSSRSLASPALLTSPTSSWIDPLPIPLLKGLFRAP
jgi:hypothetical protein